MTVSSASGDLVVDNVAFKDGNALAAGAGQTQRWSLVDSATKECGAGSTEAGAASVTMSWSETGGNAKEWAIVGVSIKPASAINTQLNPIEDTYIKLNSPDIANNFGASTSLVIDRETTDLQRALLQFDLSSVPSGATITSATLKMQATQGGDALNISVYEVLQSWTEGTGTGTAGVAYWNDRATGTAWSDAGGTFDSTAVATLNTTGTGQHMWDATALV